MKPHEYIADLLKRHAVLHFATPDLIAELAVLKAQADLATVMTNKYLSLIETIDPATLLSKRTIVT